MIGTIPSSIGCLVNLASWEMASNKLSGMMLTKVDFGKCAIYCNCLISSHVHKLIFVGSIPSTIGSLTNLVYLIIFSNKLVGNGSWKLLFHSFYDDSQAIFLHQLELFQTYKVCKFIRISYQVYIL